MIIFIDLTLLSNLRSVSQPTRARTVQTESKGTACPSHKREWSRHNSVFPGGKQSKREKRNAISAFVSCNSSRSKLAVQKFHPRMRFTLNPLTWTGSEMKEQSWISWDPPSRGFCWSGPTHSHHVFVRGGPLSYPNDIGSKYRLLSVYALQVDPVQDRCHKCSSTLPWRKRINK